LRRVLVLDPHQRYNIDNVRAHPWMHRRPAEAEIVTEHTTTQKIDSYCREQLLTIGLPAESVDTSLTAERHDHIYTSYQLLLRKKSRVEAGGGDGSAPQPPCAAPPSADRAQAESPLQQPGLQQPGLQQQQPHAGLQPPQSAAALAARVPPPPQSLADGLAAVPLI